MEDKIEEEDTPEAVEKSAAGDFSLTFFEAQQDALLGHLIDNKEFYSQVSSYIKPGYFSGKFNQRVYAAKLAFVEEFKCQPNYEELKCVKEFLIEDAKTQKALWAQILTCRVQATQHRLDIITSKLTNFVQTAMFKEAHRQSHRYYNAKKPGDAFRVTREAMDGIDRVSFTRGMDASFVDIPSLIQNQKHERVQGLTFGIKALDEKLDPDAPEGALLRGDTTVLLAPTNVGKTTTMITIAAHNIKRNKHVLFITHEGRAEDIQLKILCSMLNVSKTELFKRVADKEWWALYAEELDRLQAFLTYIPYNKAGMTVEEVVPLIRRYQEKRILQNGRGYDMLIDDYPAKLSTEEASKGNMQKRNIDEKVYGMFVQLGLEYKFHVLLAIQTNRAGSQINWGLGKKPEDRLLRMEDVQESWGTMTSATNVISINRDQLAVARGRVSFHISKSRSSDTGWTIVCKSNYAHAQTHSNEMGAVWYRSSETLSGKLDDIFQKKTDKTTGDFIGGEASEAEIKEAKAA